MTTPTAAAELAALVRSLGRIAQDVVSLLDGGVSVEDLRRLGCDGPALIQAIADLAQPNDPDHAAKVQEARALRRAARRALRQARGERAASAEADHAE